MQIDRTFGLSLLFAAFLSGCASTGDQSASSEELSTKMTPGVVEAEFTAKDEEQYQGIRQDILNKNYTVAEAKLRTFVGKFPKHANALANLGVVFAETDRYEEAEKYFTRSLSLEEDMAPVHAWLASVKKELGKINEAINAYKKAIDIDPQYSYSYYNLALLFDMYLKDYKNSHKYLTQYIKISQDESKETLFWLKQLDRQLTRNQKSQQATQQ